MPFDREDFDMTVWMREHITYNKVILSLFIGLLTFLSLQIYSKVDAMPDKFVRMERYLYDQGRIGFQYSVDQERMEKAICDIQKDVKEILRVLK